MPRGAAAAIASSAWPEVSLPSDRRTSRCCVPAGKMAAAEPDGGRDVGRADDRLRRRLGQLVELGGEAVDQRVRAEDDDAGGIGLRHLAHRVPRPADELLAGGVEHRGGCVEQEDHAQPVGRQRQPRAGQRQHEAGDKDERGSPSEAMRRPRGSVREAAQPADDDQRRPPGAAATARRDR